MKWCWRYHIDSGNVLRSEIGSHGTKNMAKIRDRQEGLTPLWVRQLESKEYFYIKQFLKVLTTCSFKKTLYTLCLITNMQLIVLNHDSALLQFILLSSRASEQVSDRPWQADRPAAGPGQSGMLAGCSERERRDILKIKWSVHFCA